MTCPRTDAQLFRDDPVRKYFPDVTHRLDGFSPSAQATPPYEAPITLFSSPVIYSGSGAI